MIQNKDINRINRIAVPKIFSSIGDKCYFSVIVMAFD